MPRLPDEEVRLDALERVVRVPHIEMARNSLAYFARHFLFNHKESRPFEIAPHHAEWSDMIEESERLCILSPRDHGKTYFWSLAFPIWWLYFHKGDDIYIFSAAQEQASRIVGDIQNQIMENPKLQHLLPEERGTWNKTATQFTTGGIYARGIGVSVRGAHPKVIICDDLLTDAQGYSKIERDRIKDYFLSAITNMVVPGGKLVVVGTPFHQDDLYSELKKKANYLYKDFPAIYEGANGKPTALWPRRYSLDYLKGRKEEIGNIRFSREFLCKPISDESSLFPYALISGCFDEVFEMPKTYQGGNKVFVGCDLAWSAQAGADYTCFITIMKDAVGNVWVLDIFREKGLSFQAQIDALRSINARYRPAMILVESNAFQHVLSNEIIRQYDMPVKPFQTGKNKNSLETGVPAIRLLFENKKMHIPRGNEESIRATNIFIEELMAFGWSQGKLQGVGAHDDTVMAFWIAMEATKNFNFSFSFV